MLAQILLLTPSPDFGKSLQHYLEGMGFSGITQVGNIEEAIALSHETELKMAILDFNIGEYPLRKTAQVMREISPNIRLLITSSQDESDPPIMSELTAVGVFSEPFYILDLKKKIPEISEMAELYDQPDQSKSLEKQTAELPWLQDINRAAQHLASISLSTSAQAALIVCEDKLWAYAGQLSQSSANELTALVVHHWSPETSSDLVRFVELEADGGGYMLYATELTESMVLALAFDAKMPFSRIRSQVNYLARALASPPGSSSLEPETTSTKEHFINAINSSGSVQHTTSRPLFSSDEVPPPTPGTNIQNRPGAGELSYDELPVNPSMENDQPELEIVNLGDLSKEHSEPSKGIPTYSEFTEIISRSSHSEEERLYSDDLFIGGSEFDSVRDEMSQSPFMYSLNYTCTMIPRLPGHELTGELADRVAGFVKHIFLAFGWRLEYLDVDARYLQWIANTPPSVSPGYMLHVMREHLSRFIFAEFPRLERENPSGDFWAPGFLLVTGSRKLPSQLINDFIERIHRNQNFQHKQL